MYYYILSEHYKKIRVSTCPNENVSLDRVCELEEQQKVLWDIINNNKDKPEIQIKAVHELHNLSVNMHKAYQTLPENIQLQVPNAIPLEKRQENFVSHGGPGGNSSDNTQTVF